jgi:hypothetical protein
MNHSRSEEKSSECIKSTEKQLQMVQIGVYMLMVVTLKIYYDLLIYLMLISLSIHRYGARLMTHSISDD